MDQSRFSQYLVAFLAHLDEVLLGRSVLEMPVGLLVLPDGHERNGLIPAFRRVIVADVDLGVVG